MARKPAHLTMQRGKPTGRQATWEAIRARKSFTINDLWHCTKQNRATIRTFVKALEAGGFVAQSGTAATSNGIIGSRHVNRSPTFVYKLKRDVGVEAPRIRRDGTPCIQGLIREQMWRTMKLLGDFTYRDLAAMARTEAAQVSDSDAKDYVKNLKKAGYIIVVQEATKRSLAVHRFVKSRNTGPLSPMVQKLKTIFDPNLCEIVWQEDAGE